MSLTLLVVQVVLKTGNLEERGRRWALVAWEQGLVLRERIFQDPLSSSPL